MALIKLAGKPINTHGELPEVGQKAPDFQLVTTKLKKTGLDRYSGQRKLLNIVPSLDTPTCARSTRKFNELALKFPNAAFLVIAADLPFAMQRFCQHEKLENVTSLSLMCSPKFAEDYGVLMIDGPLAGITARAVLVLDTDNTVMYRELVDDIKNEPDYDAAITALRL